MGLPRARVWCLIPGVTGPAVRARAGYVTSAIWGRRVSV
jgi:hypothetical protein